MSTRNRTEHTVCVKTCKVRLGCDCLRYSQTHENEILSIMMNEIRIMYGMASRDMRFTKECLLPHWVDVLKNRSVLKRYRKVDD